MLAALIIAINCWLLGFSILYLAARHFALQAPAGVLTAAGFALGAVLSTLLVQFLDSVGMGLRLSTLTCVCLGLLAGGIMVWVARTRHALAGALAPWRDLAGDRLSLLMMFLIAANLLGAAVNNLIRPIFPWDAFTTWMYRSKAWALDDQITAMAFVPDWLAAGGEPGYAIYAHHYPTALSTLAAMTSALSGGWDPAAASLLWTFAGVALAFGVYGCCRWQGLSLRSCVLACFLVMCAPLLTMHMALAGYGDSWMALYSGLGLTLLLVGRTAHHKTALIMGALLLLLGTQIKTEGWIWLGVGLGFLLLDTFRLRFGGHWLAGLLAVAAGLLWLTGITGLNLGPGGQWGVFDGALRAGSLGSYALRPYNPLGDYGDALYQHNNFGLLPLLCTLALIVLAFRRRPHSTAQLIMIGLIVATQMVIFGLSSFSEYAETGTAINRLLIHFLPVFALITVMALNDYPAGKTSEEIPEQTKDRPVLGLGRLLSDSVWSFVLLTVALLLVLAGSQGPDRNQITKVNAASLVPVVGTGNLDDDGRWRISDSAMNFGVLGSLQRLPAKARFIDLTVVGERASEVVFYWRNGDSTDMQRISVPNGGQSLIDLADHPRWNPEKVVEWGFVIPASRFNSIAVGDVTFSTALGFSNLPGLFNRWFAPPVVNQRALNNLAITYAGPTVLYGLALALGLAVLLLMLKHGLPASPKREQPRLLNLSTPGVLLLGVVILASAVWSQGFLRNAKTLAAHPSRELVDNLAAGHRTTVMAEAALASLDYNRPTVIVPGSERDEFTAQKLPLLLLPHRAVFTGVGVRHVPKTWTGQIILLGSEPDRLDTLARGIEKKLGRPVTALLDSEGFRLVR